MGQRHTRRISPDICVWDVFDGHRSRAPDGRRSAKHLDLWVVRIQLWLFLGLLRFGVRLVGIFALLQRLGYPGGVPFCVLDLLLCLVVGGAPDVDQVEKGRGRVKGCRRLPCMMSGEPVNIGKGYLLGDLVGLDHTFRPIQRFLRELLDICLSRDVVCYSVLGRVLFFCLSMVSLARYTVSTRQEAYLLELVHQVGGISQDLVVGRVELLCEDLVDNPVLAWRQSVPVDRKTEEARPTPIGYDGLRVLELGGLGRAFPDGDVCLPQGSRDAVGHFDELVEARGGMVRWRS